MTAVYSPGSVQKRPIYTWINEKRPNKKRQMGSATALKRWQQSVRLNVCKKDLCIPEYMKRDLWVAQRHLRDESGLRYSVYKRVVCIPECMKRDLYIPQYAQRDLWVARRHLRDGSSLFAWECTKETDTHQNPKHVRTHAQNRCYVCTQYVYICIYMCIYINRICITWV